MKYNIETIKSICESYGYSARNSGYQLYVNKIYGDDEDKNKENWWKPEIYSKLLNDEYDMNEYIIDRFAVCFSGYGTLTLEEENKVIKNLNMAKELVDKLNEYINICNETQMEG